MMQNKPSEKGKNKEKTGESIYYFHAISSSKTLIESDGKNMGCSITATSEEDALEKLADARPNYIWKLYRIKDLA